LAGDQRRTSAIVFAVTHHPLCAEHERQGEVVAAVVVDHIRPHKGDRALFWNRGNWQSLCKACHDRKTALEDGRWRPATGPRRPG
jgi:5-methylcytosine-specific restriction protein A